MGFILNVKCEKFQYMTDNTRTDNKKYITLDKHNNVL